MCISSLQHHKSIALTEHDKTLPKHIVSSHRHQLKTRRIRLHYLTVASLCLALATTATVIEFFALFNIQFCDGEDLMQLYWGFWSVLQVGSNIAILGVVVQFWIVLGDVETPSWAVALGTPVLVFAAIGFGFRHILKETIGRVRGERELAGDEEQGRGRGPSADEEREDVVGPRDESDSEKYPGDRSLSTAPTVVPTEAPPTRNRSVSSVSQYAPSIQRPDVGRRSTFWQRGLHYMFNSVITDHPREYARDRN